MIIRDKKDNLEKTAANLIEDSIKSLLKKQEQVILAIPGGTSVPGVFRNLLEKDIPWNKVHIFMVDERMVPIDHKDSNYRLAKECFIGELINTGRIPETNLHPFEADVSKYERELKKHGGVYDVILLSSGEDCHIGALYPNLSVKDQSDFFVLLHNSPKPPKDRMTMSRNLVLRSKAAVILFFGSHKKEAFEKFQSDESYVVCPAAIVKRIEKWYALTDNL